MNQTSEYKSELGRKNQLKRLIWSIVWPLSTWFLPRRMGNRWKIYLLKVFGAKVTFSSIVYSSAKIYDPSNLIMGNNSCLADNVNCYNVAPVYIGDNVTISQNAYLCTASHDFTTFRHSLIAKPIVIKKLAWVGAKAYIGMGVMVGEGAVIGATASVYKNVEPWTVVGGNPAKFIKNRVYDKKV